MSDRIATSPPNAEHALVLAAHGSHEEPETSDAVFAHVDRLHNREIFDEVRPAFWQGEPHLREVLRTLESQRVTVVPFTMADGYFADTVFPRELRLDPARSLATGKTVRYTLPVGTHPDLTGVIDRLARATAAEAATGLAVVGHGTTRHESSGVSTREHVTRLRSRGAFAEVEALFLDQEPGVEALTSTMSSRTVVVVPLFVANGSHATEDVPRAIGLPPNPTGGTAIDGIRLWYGDAIGTDPALTEIVVDLATAESATIVARGPADSPAAAESASEAFRTWLEAGEDNHRAWGELHISIPKASNGATRYTVRHESDAGQSPEMLDRLSDVAAVRERVRFGDDGQFRPLAGARTLPTGWIVETESVSELVRTVETVYPASIPNWYRAREGRLDVTSFEAAGVRHTGRFGALEDVSTAVRRRTVESCCDDCVRQPAWTSETTADSDGAIPCREPCSFFLDAMARSPAPEPPGPTGSSNAPDSDG